MMLFTVVALMMVMLAMSVVPAFAARPVYRCTSAASITFVHKQEARHYEAAGWTCERTEKSRR